MTKPLRWDNPMFWVGGYSLDVYCDYKHEHGQTGNGNFYGRNAAEAKREARQAGWRFNRDGSTTCKVHR